ncbi:Geminivirus AR1/BR1 coat protein, partial [Parasponia andersonii]
LQPYVGPPSISDIFQGSSPWLFAINHDNKHRFILKRKWNQRLTTVGAVTNVSTIGQSAHAIDTFEHFDKSFNLRTDWNNSASGEYSASKKVHCSGSAL